MFNADSCQYPNAQHQPWTMVFPKPWLTRKGIPFINNNQSKPEIKILSTPPTTGGRYCIVDGLLIDLLFPLNCCCLLWVIISWMSFLFTLFGTTLRMPPANLQIYLWSFIHSSLSANILYLISVCVVRALYLHFLFFLIRKIEIYVDWVSCSQCAACVALYLYPKLTKAIC